MIALADCGPPMAWQKRAKRSLTPRPGSLRGSAHVPIMAESPAQLRMKAEACRRLAELTPDAVRRELWISRAAEWERLALKASRGIAIGEKARAVAKQRRRAGRG